LQSLGVHLCLYTPNQSPKFPQLANAKECLH